MLRVEFTFVCDACGKEKTCDAELIDSLSVVTKLPQFTIRIPYGWEQVGYRTICDDHDVTWTTKAKKG